MRDSVYILEATIKTLGYNTDVFPIRKSSLKIDFENQTPEVVTVHFDGKLLPALDVRKSKEEPIVISYGNKEQLIAVPRLENSRQQARAAWKALADWNFEHKVQILCCDTTASNAGRINGACVLLEQKLDR